MLGGTRKDYLAELGTVPLLIIDALGMRTLVHTAAEDLLEHAPLRARLHDAHVEPSGR